VKGVGSMRRAILRGGLRLSGGTTIISSEDAMVEAKRWEIFLLSDVEDDLVAALEEEKATGENANEDVTAIKAMKAAGQSFIVEGCGRQQQ
jgi:hypothetical protein